MCDYNLTNNRSTGFNKTGVKPCANISVPIYKQPKRNGTLVYQDTTSCSASYAFADIYKLNNNTYDIYMDCGRARYPGDYSSENGKIEKVNVPTLAHMLHFLASYCDYEPNSTGKLFNYLIKNKELWDDNLVRWKWVRELIIPDLVNNTNCSKLCQLIGDNKLIINECEKKMK